ncbi:MAG TPA: cob(I)yrinic acid a,c-diamide adenosyltransferase [Actinomycetota bacterium]|nr:cob(I)yrinic acid a,c-diamide adenosyltransferase [Actinomycetota bacterium]
MTVEPPARPPERPPRERADSLVIVNTGDGKGKSTAAFGTMLRAVARGWRVCVVQFLKSGQWRVGEEEVGRKLGVEWWTTGDGFTWNSKDMDETEARARAAWEAAAALVSSGEYHMVLLDEVTYPINYGWIDVDAVVATLRGRPAHVNVIVTGRDAPGELVELADTVTEMRKVKHAYDRGVGAKRGIDL